MSANRVCAALNIEKPVIQGPMAWSAFAPLVAAVSNAGGLGVLGVASAPPHLVREQIVKTRELTDKPFGVNVFMIPPLTDMVAPVLLEEKPAVVYADVLNDLDPALCDKFFTPLKEAGIKIIVKASTLKDAIVAEENGACMAGMIAPLVKEIRPAAVIIDSTIAGCKEVIAKSAEFTY